MLNDHALAPSPASESGNVLGRGPVKLVVTRAEFLTPRIKRFELRSANGEALPEWTPGSHIQIPVRISGARATRSYSLMGDCEQRDAFEISVLREDNGRGGSRYVHSAFQVGMTLATSEPTNHFELHDDGRPSLLIAGGIGITPLRSMAIALAKRNRRFALHYAARAPEETALRADLLARFGPDVRFWYSRGPRPNRLDLSKILNTHTPSTVIYVCGPIGLIQSVLNMVDEIQFSRENVRYERFVSAEPSPDNHAFDVHLTRSGKIVHVTEGVTILDAVLEAGVAAEFGCRIGECGACAVDLLDGDADHRDTALDENDRKSGGRVCICVSRARGDRLAIDL